MKTIKVIALSLLLLFGGKEAITQDNLAIGLADTLFNFNLNALDVCIVDGYGYVAGGTSGLWVIDIVDVEGYFPEIIRAEESMNILDIVVLDGLLYAADASFGLRIFNADPQDLHEIGCLEVWGQPQDVFLDDSMLYLATGDHGMHRIDVSDPSAPELAGYYNRRCMTRAVAASEQYAYLFDTNFGLRTINLSAEGGFTEVARLNYNSGTDLILIDDNLIGSSKNALYYFDISQPALPEFRGRFPQQGNISSADIAFFGNQLFAIAKYPPSVYVIDCANMEDYSQLAVFNTDYQPWGIGVYDDIALVACGTDGVRAWNVSDVDNSFESGYFGDYAHCFEVAQRDHYLFQAFGEGGLLIFDIIDPLQPELVYHLETEQDMRGVFLNGSFCYATLKLGGVCVIDISNIEHPISIADWEDGIGECSDIAFIGDMAILGCRPEGIHVVDVSNPAEAVELGLVAINAITHFATKDSLVYFVVENPAFFTLDVRTPGDPQIINQFQATPSYSYGRDVVVYGDYAYASFQGVGLAVFDISDPLEPRQISIISSPEAQQFSALQIVDSLLYVEDNGVRVFNLADPSYPVEIGHFTEINYSCGLAVYEDIAYVPNTQSLNILDCSGRMSTCQPPESRLSPQSMILTGIYPNPFNSTTTIGYLLPTEGIVKVAVFDLSGREVARLADGVQEAGSHEAVWQANDMSAGIYYVRLQTEHSQFTEKILLVK